MIIDPDEEDLVTQVQQVKAIDNTTKTWVYRQGQGAGSPSGSQAKVLLDSPQFAGFFLKSAVILKNIAEFPIENVVNCSHSLPLI